MRDAAEIASFFQEFPPIGKMAYHLIVKEDGKIEQALPLHYNAPGAINLNPNFIQVGVVGNFKKKPPTVAQGLALSRLCTSLCRVIGTMDVRGHVETEGAYSDPSKQCPGEHLNMAGLRATVIKEYDKADELEGLVL